MAKNKPMVPFRTWMFNSKFGSLLEPLYFAKRYLWVYRPWLTDRQAIERVYLDRFGYIPDLDNPKTFNEKVQWLKLNDKDALKVICADKYKVRDFIIKNAGMKYAIPCLMVAEDISDIRPENLPTDSCVIKTNHDQGTVFLVKNKLTTDFKKIRVKLRIALKTNLYHYSREWVYSGIPPRVIVEPLLDSGTDAAPKDYKIFCFNGVPRLVQVDHDRFTDHKRNLYDCDWKPLTIEYGYSCGPKEDKPKCFPEMLKVAAALSRPFLFVRVDFFVINGEPLVGEMTFFPESGLKKFSPPTFDMALGDMLQLPTNSI